LTDVDGKEYALHRGRNFDKQSLRKGVVG